MIDHLAMGASTVGDRAPYPEWPLPLQAGRELMGCDCGIGEDESLPEKADYGRIASTVMELLADPDRVETCRRAAADYFDKHVTPSQIARYLVEVSEQVRERTARIRVAHAGVSSGANDVARAAS
jgi:hypothetical protein